MSMLHLQSKYGGAETGGCPNIVTNFVTQVFRSICVASVRTPAHLLYLPLLSTGINTFSIVFLPQKVSHELYRQLYPNIIRDIDARSYCTTSFHSYEREK